MPRNNQIQRDKYQYFDLSLASIHENVPPVDINDTPAPLTYVGQSVRGQVPGDDPFWEQAWGFTGHIRAPFDKRAMSLGIIPNQHIWEINPLAGTGSSHDNVSFLTDEASPEVEGVGYDSLGAGETIDGRMDGMYHPQVAQDVLAPGFGANAQIYTDYEDGTGKVYEECRANLFQYDRNLLQSEGLEMVNDPRGNSVLTYENEAIPFYVDGSIKQVAPDPNKLDDAKADFKSDSSYWISWYGYEQQFKTARPEIPKDELFYVGNPFQQHISGADSRATEFSMYNKGVFIDEQKQQDDLVFQAQERQQDEDQRMDISQQARERSMLDIP